MINLNRSIFRCEYCYVEFFKYGSLLVHKEHYCYKRKKLPRSSTVTTQTLGQECSKTQIVSEGAGSSKKNNTSGSEFARTLVEQIELSSIKNPYFVGGSNGITVYDDKVSSTKNQAFGSEFEGILAGTEFDLAKQKDLSSTKSPYLVGGSNDIIRNVSITKFTGMFISKRKLSELESPVMEVAKRLETPIKDVVNVLETQYDGMETETSSMPNVLTGNSINTWYHKNYIHPPVEVANQYGSYTQHSGINHFRL